jgi:hypothetical protein
MKGLLEVVRPLWRERPAWSPVGFKACDTTHACVHGLTSVGHSVRVCARRRPVVRRVAKRDQVTKKSAC